jgi:hypothetical protein
MQTIRIPKNLLFLSDKLPQANYEIAKSKSNELPDLKRRIKSKNREILQENLDNSIGDNNPQIASIIKKKNTRDSSDNNNIQILKNSNNNNEEDVMPIKLIEKREKSPSG